MKDIIDLLQLSDYYGCSKRIDIAKGKYQFPHGWKELKKLIKRNWNGK
jgi:hypothetical protein